MNRGNRLRAVTLAGLAVIMSSSAWAGADADNVLAWTDRLIAEASRRAERAEQAARDQAIKLEASEPANVERLSKHEPASELLPDLIRKILRDEGLPETLIAVAKVESGLSPLALSPKGARGIWQLMPDTARNFGLVVDSNRDDRVDPIKSTITAARFLRSLYSRWADWNLVFAAYNAGPGAVERALTGGDGWSRVIEERLPAETREYVPKVWSEIYRIDSSGLPKPEVVQ